VSRGFWLSLMRASLTARPARREHSSHGQEGYCGSEERMRSPLARNSASVKDL